MLPVLSLGPLSLPVPNLLPIVGLVLGSWLTERWAPRLRLAAKVVSDILFYSVLIGLVGARLFVVLRTPQAFLQSPTSLVSLNPALLDPLGGVLTAVLAAWWLAQRRGLSWWRLADGLTPFLAVMQIALALRAAAQGDFFGLPTTLPWGVDMWGATRHPTQLYWALGALMVLALVHGWIRDAAQAPTPPPAGLLFWRFVALSAFVFVLVAGFRGDSPVTASGWRLDQIAGVMVLAVALYHWQRRATASPA